jgi:aminopeptidase YwaD
MSYRGVARRIFDELSGERAKAITTEITKYHRPPGSKGYHEATDYVAKELRESGLQEVSTSRYPLDAQTPVGHSPLPMAWEPYSAKVSITSPVSEEVVDLDKVSSCLAWWSIPTPEGGISAELVDVGTGETEADFNQDISGKIVLIGHTERPGGWMHAAKEAMKRGAVGILSDYLFYTFKPDRTRDNLPEAVQLLRLPNQQGNYNAWACSISHTTGQRLRELLKDGPVTIHADIQAKIFKGEGQNLLAVIPGSELPEESVFFVAHTSAATCPCANCAAGPALMAEIARTLNTLIEKGAIERPRRSIKFLIIVEGSGSKAYIAEHPDELQRIKTVFCFDSVGHDQSKLKSSLLFYKHPDAFPSFINDYFASVMERAPKDGSWVFKNDTDQSPIRFYQAPYTPWSDNHIWTAYDIASPLLMSWPDLYFHSQFLTADKTDPKVFRAAGISTALAAYEIANADESKAQIMASEVYARSLFRLEDTANKFMSQISELDAETSGSEISRLLERTQKKLSYFADRDGKAIQSVQRLIHKGSESSRRHLKQKAEQLKRHADELSNQLETSIKHQRVA